MRSSRTPRVRRVLALALVACLHTVLAGTSVAAGPPPPADAGARYLERTYGGTAAGYRLVDAQPAAHDPSGRRLWAGKYVDVRSGRIHIVYRSATAETFGPAVLRERFAAALAELSPVERKSDPALLAARTNALRRGGATIPVGIWVKLPASDGTRAVAAVKRRYPQVRWIGDRPVVSDPALLDRVIAELYLARQHAYGRAGAPAADAVRTLGGRVGHRSTSAPLLFATLPAGALGQLAARDDVTALRLDAGGWQEQMSIAGPTVHADWASDGTDEGKGVRVAVVEYHNVRGSGDLTGRVVASHSTSGRLRYASGFDHPTWVAGAIASRDRYDRGIAPGASIVSSSTGGGSRGVTRDEDIVRATDWAVSATGGRAKIVSLSVVQDTTSGSRLAREYFDSLAHAASRLSVAAAGNYGLGLDGEYWVGSPGTGWNVLTVGGTEDRDTRDWRDDRLWYHPGGATPTGSSWRERPDASYNPHGDLAKPDVSAPAFRVRTANGLIASGTSVATPIVSGICAQLLARRPELAAWPVATRAIVMAGAIHHARMASGAISREHEGVGTASGVWTQYAAGRGGGVHGGYALGQMTSAARFSRSFSVAAGQRARVALTWESQAVAESGAADALTADLELRLWLPDGTSVLSSSFDNSHEFLEITSRRAGKVTIEVLAPRFDADTEYWALAWTKF